MSVLDEYFEWLCDRVDCSWEPGSEYYIPLKVMFETEFKVIVANDINRKQDGEALRKAFSKEYGYRVEEIFKDEKEPCSVLEMLVALVERMSWEMMDEVRDNSYGRWFKEILSNLGITRRTGFYKAEEIVNVANNREYEDDGIGGYFPLKSPQKACQKRGQKWTEIWYQMQNYFSERFV